jgi:N-(2-amino-2-carboxyethyl)-L-glutamate synthase
MIDKLEKLRPLIGNTPMRKLNVYGFNVYVKLEYNNFSGSVKDRAAFNILYEALLQGRVSQHTKIVESSSGNFAISLGMICKELGLEFVPVIDPNINADYEKLLRLLTPHVVKVSEMDRTGGYLLNRIAKVKEICAADVNVFWPNQYENGDNYKAYYQSLGNELCRDLDRIDYAFIGVSSGGTITGTSLKLKEYFPNVKIIAVDVEGSVIFGESAKKRHLSGLGSSKRPLIIDRAIIDEVVYVTEEEIIEGCNQLLVQHTVMGGASCGAAFKSILKYVHSRRIALDSNIVFLCPDKGVGYLNTIYTKGWLAETKLKTSEEIRL